MITSGFDNQECKLDCAWAVFSFQNYFFTVQQITNHFKWLLIGQKWIAFFECGQIGNKIDQIKSWLVVCSSHGSTRQAINVTDCPPNCHNSIKIPKRTLFFQKRRIFSKTSHFGKGKLVNFNLYSTLYLRILSQRSNFCGCGHFWPFTVIFGVKNG